MLRRPTDGRLFIVFAKRTVPEPRTTIGATGLDAAPVLGQDVRGFTAGRAVTLGSGSAIFPIERLSKLPAGQYYVQALFHFNRDINVPNAPGDIYSAPLRLRVDPKHPATIRLTLSHALPADTVPKETTDCKFARLQSKLLSKFHGRPIYLRAGVLLPRDYGTNKQDQYPLWVHIGGFGSRYSAVLEKMRDKGFKQAWLANESPRMVLLELDGAGPLGDPYQVNSANNGPYGDAITQELIPYVEKRFRCMGKPYARFLSGGSTGGWVSLALQVFYPGFFNGCWSVSPDGVDFRALQLVDIYHDKNAFINRFGFERPSKRRTNGDVEYTMRHDIQRENLMGMGNCYTMSGDQWGAWNAVYGPRGKDGRPVPIWNAKTGKIDPTVADRWKPYDLRLYLQENWSRIGLKLRRKIHISVGDADDYFLNNGVRLLDAFLSKAEPKFEGEIRYAPEKGHVWSAWSTREMMQQMSRMLEMGMEP